MTKTSVVAQWRTSGPIRIPSTNSKRTLGTRNRRNASEHSGAMATAAAITKRETAVWYDMDEA